MSAFELVKWICAALAVLFICAFLYFFVLPKWINRHFPGPPVPSFLFGHFSLLVSKPGQTHFATKEMSEKYGSVFQIYLLHRRIIYCSHPDDIQHIMMSRDNRRSDHVIRALGKFLGNGLICEEPQMHKVKRNSIQQIFNASILCHVRKHMNKELTVSLKQYENLCDTQQVFDFDRASGQLFLNVVSRVCLGVPMTSHSSVGSEIHESFSQMGIDMSYYILLYPFAVLYKYRRIKRDIAIMRGFIQVIVDERKSESPEHKKAREMDLLDVFRTVPGADDYYLVSEITTFLTAGHDTTAHTCSFLLYEVCRHPEVEKRIVEEVETVFGSSLKNDFVIPSEESIQKLKYCGMVLDEALRMYPPVAAGIERQVGKDEVLPASGVFIPKGTQVNMQMYTMQTDRKYWSEPDKFIPERFLKPIPRGAKKNGPCFVPFGMGGYSCIGKFMARFEALALVAILFSRYKIRLACKPDEVQHYAAVTLRPKTNCVGQDGKPMGLPVTFQRRA